MKGPSNVGAATGFDQKLHLAVDAAKVDIKEKEEAIKNTPVAGERAGVFDTEGRTSKKEKPDIVIEAAKVEAQETAAGKTISA